MSNLAQIQQAIEQTRSALNLIVGAKNWNPSDPKVTELSARLDELIVRHERLRGIQGTKGESR